MGKIQILQSGGGWITNIGNAFLDMGSIECLTEAANKANVEFDIHVHSSAGRWIFFHTSRGIKGYFLKRGGRTDNAFNLYSFANVDYAVQWGSFLFNHWLQIHGDVLVKLSQKGVKVIFLGGGIGEGGYSENEIHKTREYLKKIQPYVLVSRDKDSFDSFKDLAEHAYDGIDCAFWINDAYVPLKLEIPEYFVFNFDKYPEPKNLAYELDKDIVRAHHSLWYKFPLSQFPRMKKQYYDMKNTLISDLPYEYLDLYANASATYSDRVHACVVSLAYDKPARLYGNPDRAKLFDKVGALEIGRVLTTPMKEKIQKEKQKQTDFISEILKGK